MTNALYPPSAQHRVCIKSVIRERHRRNALRRPVAKDCLKSSPPPSPVSCRGEDRFTCIWKKFLFQIHSKSWQGVDDKFLYSGEPGSPVKDKNSCIPSKKPEKGQVNRVHLRKENEKRKIYFHAAHYYSDRYLWLWKDQ